jgi:hypothetical protein
MKVTVQVVFDGDDESTAVREVFAVGVRPDRVYVDHGLTGTGPGYGRHWPRAGRATPWW